MNKIILKIFGICMVAFAALHLGSSDKAHATPSDRDTTDAQKLETTTHGCGCACAPCTTTSETDLKS